MTGRLQREPLLGGRVGVPELPEVETIRRSLEPHLVGRSIEQVTIDHPHVTGPTAPQAFVRALRGRSITRLWRRGKYMVWDLGPEGSEASPLHVVAHLRMTGRLRYLQPRHRWTEDLAHTHARLRLGGGGRLFFHDVRKFGRLLLAGSADLQGMLPTGRDPILEGLNVDDLHRILKNRTGKLKALLLRQDLLCGLGNIYADEALHRAGIHPEHSPADLAYAEYGRLAAGIVAVLEEALAFRGTTLLDYRSGDGERGAFAQYLRVYGRGGRSCRNCGATILTIRVGGRTTAFCPGCQRP